MFRVSFAAILGAVAATNATVSPLAAATFARDNALEQSNQTLHSLMRAVQEAHDRADNKSLVDQEVATIEAAVPNTTDHFSKQRKHLMHQREHAMKEEVDEKVDTAKAAATAFKHAARLLETQRRHAGLHESFYEAAWDQDENLAEGWRDEAENQGDEADNYIEAFFDAVEDKLEVHVDQQRRDHDEQQEDEHDERGNGQQNHSSTALNLRAVVENPRNDGQGFLLTFACVGFLASMAFAAQMQRRPTRSPAREPLITA